MYSVCIVCVLCVYSACISRYRCPCTAVCTLGQLQRKVKYAKMMKGGNIQVQNMLEMGQLIQPLLMPPQVCDLVPAAAGVLSVPVRNMLYVPMDAASFDVHGACFTGPMQVKWIGQLCELDYSFVGRVHMCTSHTIHNCPRDCCISCSCDSRELSCALVRCAANGRV